MIEVAFKGDETIIKSDQHVYQWDTGQKVMVSGLGDSNINQVHFSFNGLKTAYPVNVTNSSGTVTVNIPNIVLRYGKDVYMYLCIKNTNGTVVTIKTVIIPVIKRNMPENYMYDDNETVAIKLDELQTEIQRSTGVDTDHEARLVSLEEAKTNASGKTFDTLKARIDADVNVLNEDLSRIIRLDSFSKTLEKFTLYYTSDDEFAKIMHESVRAISQMPVKFNYGDKATITIKDDSKVRLSVILFDNDSKIIHDKPVDSLWTKTGSITIENFDGYLGISYRYSDNSDVTGISNDIDSDVSITIKRKENKESKSIISEVYSGRIVGDTTSVHTEDNLDCFYTNMIPVVPGEIYSISCCIAGVTSVGNALGVTGFTSNDINTFSEWLFNIQIAGETVNNWYTYIDKKIQIPKGVNYIALCTRAVGLSSALSNPNSWIKKVSNEIDMIKFYSDNDIHFNGLNGVAFGCSLTARGRDNDPEYPAGEYFGYLRELQKVSGIEFDNQGVGGSCLYAQTDSIYSRVIAYDDYADKDIAIIEGDFNGWNTGKPLGTYKDIGKDTTCGCLYNAVKHIKTQNANTTVFVLLDHYGKKADDDWNGTSTEVRNGLTQYEYYSELKKVCEYHGFICIPMYECTNINELNPQYLTDFIHLNALGEKQCGQAIYQQMKNYIKQL